MEARYERGGDLRWDSRDNSAYVTPCTNPAPSPYPIHPDIGIYYTSKSKNPLKCDKDTWFLQVSDLENDDISWTFFGISGDCCELEELLRFLGTGRDEAADHKQRFQQAITTLDGHMEEWIKEGPSWYPESKEVSSVLSKLQNYRIHTRKYQSTLLFSESMLIAHTVVPEKT